MQKITENKTGTFKKVIVVLLLLLLTILLPLIGSDTGVLKDTDKDGIPDIMEKISGLDVSKDDCAPAKCGNVSIHGLTGDEYYILILDQSLSMEAKLGNLTRMETAKNVVTHFLSKFPGKALKLGVYSYGRESCEALDTHQSPFETLDKPALKEKINALQPLGDTPIAKSLSVLREALQKKEGRYHVMLITDGVESCGGNPVEEGKKLVALNGPELYIQLNVIGLGVSQTDAAELKTISEATDGKYYNANTAEELESIFEKPIRAIVNNMNGVLCLHKQLDKLLHCETGRQNKLGIGYQKLNSVFFKDKAISEADKGVLLDNKIKTEDSIQKRIDLYTTIKKDGTSNYILRINELTKFLVPEAEDLKEEMNKKKK